jgi:hypothetical protein
MRRQYQPGNAAQHWKAPHNPKGDLIMTENSKIRKREGFLMTVQRGLEDDFAKYKKPLEKLAQAFRAAGLKIKFHAYKSPYGIMICVNGGFSSQKNICIEADSTLQAVKDVAEGVKIC